MISFVSLNVIITAEDLTLKNAGPFFEGNICLRENGFPDITYNWGCQEIYQKNPQLYYAIGDNVVFVPDSPLVGEFEKKYSNWEQSLLFLRKEIYNAILELKGGKIRKSSIKKDYVIMIPEKTYEGLLS